MLIVRPDRLASTDETEATTNLSGGSTMHRDKKVVIDKMIPEDKGESLTNKTS